MESEATEAAGPQQQQEQRRLTVAAVALERFRGDRTYAVLAEVIGASSADQAWKWCNGVHTPGRAAALRVANSPAKIPVEDWDRPARIRRRDPDPEPNPGSDVDGEEPAHAP